MSPGGQFSEIDAYSSHQLTRWDELITGGAHAKYVGEARIDAVLIRQVPTDQLDPPVGVGRREAQHPSRIAPGKRRVANPVMMRKPNAARSVSVIWKLPSESRVAG